jgi:hypothetical protein
MMEISNNWYGGMDLREYLCKERNRAAFSMHTELVNGDDGLEAAGAWEALDDVIKQLDAKTPAAGATATDEQEN